MLPRVRFKRCNMQHNFTATSQFCAARARVASTEPGLNKQRNHHVDNIANETMSLSVICFAPDNRACYQEHQTPVSESDQPLNSPISVASTHPM